MLDPRVDTIHHVIRGEQNTRRHNKAQPLLQRARLVAPAPIRGLTCLLLRTVPFCRGRQALRLQRRRLPRTCHTFRRGELPEFFAVGRPGARTQPKKSAAVEKIVELRKRNYSIYEISQELKAHGTPLSATAVGEVLAAEGFARLPRRRDDEGPARHSPANRRGAAER